MPAKKSSDAGPNVVASWTRIAAWLKKNAKDISGEVLPAAGQRDVAELEKAIGQELPPAVRAAWELHGGQRDADAPGAMAGFVLLSPAQALAEWRSWDELRREQSEEALEELSFPCKSFPADAIAGEYTVPGWIPLWQEPGEGNYLGVDLTPGPAGCPGQVINFGRDEDEKVVLFWSYGAALQWMADELERGAVKLELDGEVTYLGHEDGRILSVLTERAREGKLPMGEKPKSAPAPKPAAARKPAAAPMSAKSKPAAKGKAEPAPTPDRLPDPAQVVLDDIVKMVRESLIATAPTARTALSHQTFDDDRRPLASPVTGDPLSITPDDDDLECNRTELGKRYRDMFQKSLEGGLPLHQIELRFRREADVWTHEVALETAENYKRRTAARKKLDGEIGAALVAFADQVRPEWESLTLNYEDYEHSRRKGLVVISARPRPVVDLSPDAALTQLFAKVQELYAAFGRRMITTSWRVEKAKPGKVDVNSYYA